MPATGDHRHVRSWISYHAHATPERVAVRDLDTGTQHTYRELDERIARAAAVLAGEFGVRCHDRVAMASHTRTEAYELMYACAHLGAIFVPLNIRLADPELDALLEDAEPVLVVGEPALIGREFAAGIPRLAWGDAYESALARATPQEPDDVPVDEPWVILYTSGTTGRPKGVVVTHAGSEATMLGAVMAGGLSAESVSLTVLPIWHAAGLSLFANPTLFVGGTVVLMHGFEPERVLALLTDAANPISHFAGVPAHYQFMQACPGFDEARFGPLVASVGAAPVPATLVAAWRERGVTLRPGYGCTEAGAIVFSMPPDPRTNDPGDVGIPMWHVRCRVTADGRECAPGEPGELEIRGASVTPGYWNRPEETARTIVDGWLRTGDVATIGTDGHVTIHDRIKDMYISGGENVYPAEVENALYRHPAVAEVAVVGVADERWGHSGVAWVVLHPGETQGEESLREWARGELAGFKLPREFRFVDQLPRNATGKVLKAELRARLGAGG